MVLAFDLDDTLYPELSFVKSGFCAVAIMLEESYGLERSGSMARMLCSLHTHGRGAVFNDLLKSRRLFSNKLVQRCIQVYRRHVPKISLYPEARKILDEYCGESLYLITDGNKNVQANKIRALCIEPYFKKVYITHRYGVRNTKPSVYCFDLIRKLERCQWTDMAYVGDNPAKDFVNLNTLGVLTIRVLTGEHDTVAAKPGYEAKLRIGSLVDLPSALNM